MRFQVIVLIEDEFSEEKATQFRKKVIFHWYDARARACTIAVARFLLELDSERSTRNVLRIQKPHWLRFCFQTSRDTSMRSHLSPTMKSRLGITSIRVDVPGRSKTIGKALDDVGLQGDYIERYKYIN